ncbi:alpha/beta hydrolase [Propioniciclava soli]|uniref:Alpha/beta hydrolase n=1 Tax=Propioniciclava soli TaxID=2775081 RepID=A0ABZ3C7P2_9ACTN
MSRPGRPARARPILAFALGAGAWFGVRTALASAPVRALGRVAPRWRTPLLLLPPDATRRPPRRGGLAAVLPRLLPPGLGVPTMFDDPGAGVRVGGYLYDPPTRNRPSGAVLWLHGGGMITGGPWMSHGVANRLARELGVLVIAIDYRLAPEHPFPAALDDAMTALCWLHDHAEELGLDPARIAVGGESAGGGLAAVLAQRAHDEGVPLAFQVLIYPMLDDRTVLADPAGRGELVWTPAQNRIAWTWFLGHPPGRAEPRPYAAASRREDLTGLAPAWIGVGDLDLFHDEDVAYAHRLEQSGVPAELVVEPGMPHAADMLPVPGARAFTRAWTAALARALRA